VTRAEFVAIVAPVAVKVRAEGGPLFPSVSLAQTILETGGKVHKWNNIVGYKVGSGKQTPYWHGRSVSTKTWEVYDGVRYDGVQANWRAYDSIEDCLKDQALLFLNNPGRYQRVIDAKDPKSQAEALRACGYATDPEYANKIWSIIRSGGFEKYDREAEAAMEAIKELQQAVRNLKEENVALREQIAELKEQHALPEIPEWAKAAVEAFRKTQAADGSGPLVANPEGGSFDFYRFVTILFRAGIGRK